MSSQRELRQHAALVERRVAQIQVITGLERPEAEAMLREFCEQVVRTDIYPLEDYTPLRIVEWYRRRHATVPRPW